MDVGDDAGYMLGPIGGGLLWDTWGIVGLMAGRIVLAALAEIYATTVLWRRAPERTPGPLLERGHRLKRIHSPPSAVTSLQQQENKPAD